MKNNGSILIFVLLTFTFITMGALLAVFMASEQIEIANNSMIKIQSQYLAEAKINKVFYDERYYQEQVLPSIMNHTASIPPKYTLDSSDIFFEDDNWVNGRFYDFEGKRYIELSTISEFQGSRTRMKAYGTVFNEIFYDNNPALSYSTINGEHLDKFNCFMDEISYDKINLDNMPSNLTAMEVYNYERVRMEKTAVNRYRIITKEFMEEEEVLLTTRANTDRIFMIVANPQSEERAKLYIDQDVYFRGVLYVEGDLVINSDFRFLGLVIVKGDIIFNKDLESKPRIEGIILYDGELDLNDWDLKYDRSNINVFGISLPNFIEAKLEVYKFMEGN